MKIPRRTIFGVLLAGGVALAVAGLVAQGAPESKARRMLRLDGPGAQLGVAVRDLDAEGLKAAAGATSGVRIEDVDSGSPAAKAGLREGDIVVEVDGERVRSARQFSRVIAETAEGRTVTLGVVRGGERQSIAVTPEARGLGFGFDADRLERDITRGLRDIEPRIRELEPRLREFRFDGPFNFDFDMPRLTSPRARLGIQMSDMTPQLAEYFGAKDGGVLVSSVSEHSAAAKAGLKAGDVITSINGDRVRDLDDLVDELRNKSGEVTIGILRDKKESTVKATIEAPQARRRVRPARPV